MIDRINIRVHSKRASAVDTAREWKENERQRRDRTRGMRRGEEKKEEREDTSKARESDRKGA